MIVTISEAGDLSDPRTRVMAAESAVRTICQQAGEDPADGTMILLTAAAHLARQYLKPNSDIMTTLATALGSAIVASDEFFKLRSTP